MGLFSFLKIKKVKYALVFDVANSSVGVALITHNHNKETSPKILYTYRQDIEFEKENNTAESLTKNLKKTFLNVSNKAFENINLFESSSFDIHIIMHSPWMKIVYESKEQKWKKKQKITRKLLRTFIQKTFSDYLKSNTLLATHISEIKLNDYIVDNPIGNYANKISIKMFFILTHTVIKNYFINSLHKQFENRKIIFNSFYFASLFLSNKYAQSKKNYLLADIGGEFMHIYLIQNGFIKGDVSIEFGSNFIQRTIESKTGIPKEIIKSKLNMINSNAFAPSETKKIKDALLEEEKVLITLLGDALQKLSSETKLPSSLYIAVADFARGWFFDIFSRVDFAQFTISNSLIKPSDIIDNTNTSIYYLNSRVRKDKRLLINSLFVDRYTDSYKYDKIYSK